MSLKLTKKGDFIDIDKISVYDIINSGKVKSAFHRGYFTKGNKGEKVMNTLKKRILETAFVLSIAILSWVLVNLDWAIQFEATVMEGGQPVVRDVNFFNMLAVSTHNHNHEGDSSKQVLLRGTAPLILTAR